ncbi:MAG: carbohydrate kinase family protein [Halobacteriota archaeon]
MEQSIDVIGFGALNCDMICTVEKIPLPGQEVGIISVEREPGGSAANTIVGLTRLGVRTGFLGVVGDDIKGTFLLNDLRKENVDVQGIDRLEGETGTALAFIDTAGERTIYVLPSVNDVLTTVNCDFAWQADILHVSSFMNAQQLRTQVECIKRANDQGARISFTPGNAYAALGVEPLAPIIERAFVMFLNDEEAQALTGTPYEESADMLLRLGAQAVAITLGGRGCFIATRDEHVLVPPFETAVRDTVGAGDAFAAGFLYGQIQEASTYQSGLYGNYLASKCIAEFGARRGLTLTADELLGLVPRP